MGYKDGQLRGMEWLANRVRRVSNFISEKSSITLFPRPISNLVNQNRCLFREQQLSRLLLMSWCLKLTHPALCPYW